eukprot:IDg23351t1
MRHDQGTQFVSPRLQMMAAEADEIPEGAPRGFGIPRKKPAKPVGVKNEYLLTISVICMNSTVGPEGICSNAFSFQSNAKASITEFITIGCPQ